VNAGLDHAPVIETARLRLRPPRLEDYPACVAMWADPRVVEHITGVASTPQQTWARVLGYAGHWMLLGFGYWAIEDRASATYVGELGFADFKREIDPEMRGVPEAGWALAPTARGRGFATEALVAAVAWADRALASTRTIALIAPANVASLRVAEKAGYRMFKSGSYRGEPTSFYERERSKALSER